MLALLAALAAAATPAPVQASSSPLPIAAPAEQNLVVARQMLVAMYPPSEREKLFSAMQDGLMANMIPGFKSGMEVTPGCRCDQMIDRFSAIVSEDAREHPVDMNKLFEVYARAYARNFTVADMQSITSFVGTTAGSRFMQRGQVMVSDPDVSRLLTEQTAASIKRLGPKLSALRAEMAAAKTEGVKR